MTTKWVTPTKRTSKFICKNYEKCRDAAASAQTAQECREILRIPEDSETNTSHKEGPGTMAGLQEIEVL
jgi:hypothetical protein